MAVNTSRLMALTLDLDWAPDFAIIDAARLLVERKVRATWFITHRSPALDYLRKFPDLFELGVHPNFLPGSSHGRTEAEVLRHCLQLVPEATSFRTHSLVQSTPLLEGILRNTPLRIDLSLFLPGMPHIAPVRLEFGGRTLLRLPYYWEDSYEIGKASPRWTARRTWEKATGMEIYNFHPIHTYLNTAQWQEYEHFKRAFSRSGDLRRAKPDRLEGLARKGQGTRTMFLRLIDHLSRTGESICVRDLRNGWKPSLPASGGKVSGSARTQGRRRSGNS